MIFPFSVPRSHVCTDMESSNFDDNIGLILPLLWKHFLPNVGLIRIAILSKCQFTVVFTCSLISHVKFSYKDKFKETNILY